MLRVLVVDDDPAIARIMVRYLEKAGFQARSSGSAELALESLRSDAFDLAVLDITLPGMSGTGLCRRIRADFGLPVIMMTARGGIDDKADAFRSGADDYVVKPFDPNELVLRVQAVLKRVRESTGLRDPELYEASFAFGREGTPTLTIDGQRAEARIDGRRIEIPRKEYLLLVLLAHNPGRALSRGRITESLWGLDFDGDERVVDLYVDRLRRRLETEVPASWRIRTVRGVGYMLEVDR